MGIRPWVFTNKRKREKKRFQKSTWTVMSERSRRFRWTTAERGVCIVRLVNVSCRNPYKEKRNKRQKKNHCFFLL